MKKCVSMLVALCLILACVLTSIPTIHAAPKAEVSRAIAIVFDNSGSMYLKNKPDWSRATYAMEVFASMLNKGDTLTIYPMWPIEVEGATYTMENPFQITDASQSSKIREIYTPDAKGTPIESIDCAAEGLKAATASKKYMIVLTDGDKFYVNNVDQGKKTKSLLDGRFSNLIGPDMTVMYLGVGKDAVMPDTESEYFIKKHAKNSEDVLSSLTEMCNLVFGRDSLPKGRIKGKTINFDISMSKVIVFVQGENVDNLKVTGASGEMGTLAGSTKTKYSTKGCGNYKSVPDTSLQGMMVTYTDCAAGQYNIEFSGKESNIEVYYEPDADLDFVFTDAEGNDVDPKELYEGEYKVSFGMKDAKTGQIIESDLLGSPHYEGSYFINGKEEKFSSDGLSGEVPVSLKMDDAFEANLTATYLSGYKISKDSTDFGWPEGGIKVAAMPAGKLRLEVSGGARTYPLQSLEKGEPFIVKVFYQGQQLKGEELKKVQLKWDPNTSYVELKQTFAEDHYKISLHYKNPDSPKDTVCGKCKVSIQAVYAAPGSDEATTKKTLVYNIEEDLSPVKMHVSVPQDYIVIKELDDSSAITVKFLIKGEPMTAEQFARIKLDVGCEKIEHTVTANEKDSSYTIKLKSTKGIAEGEYPIDIKATYTDFVGRQTDMAQSVKVTLSNIALWVKWIFGILLLLILLFIIWKIAHIKVLPYKAREIKSDCFMTIGGKNVTEDPGTDFRVKKAKNRVEVITTYNDNELRVRMNKITPHKESFLYKSQQKRSFMVEPNNVDVMGAVTGADINGISYKLNKDGNFVPTEDEPIAFQVVDGATVTIDGNAEINGQTKRMHAEVPLTFAKKKK